MLSQYQGFLGLAYPWVKAAHITFVIFWIAGLFIVPRYYIHHQATTPGSAEDRAWIERLVFPTVTVGRSRQVCLAPERASGNQRFVYQYALAVLCLPVDIETEIIGFAACRTLLRGGSGIAVAGRRIR